MLPCVARIRPIIWQHLDKALSGASDATPAASPGEAVNGTPAGADATSSAAVEDAVPSPEEQEEEGATPQAAAGAPPGVAS